MKNNLKRHYVHGDQSEDNQNKYFCRACDIFVDKDHFATFSIDSSHKDRYKQDIDLYNYLKKSDKTYYRPESACNVFA